MTNSKLKMGTAALAAMLLAGCQSSPLAGWTFDRGEGKRVAAQQRVKGSEVLEEGRMYLRQGNISKAVASFQLARLDKSTAAAANNGLAVSYAKLGRPDLAERYFRTAASLDPNESKYVANLLRLQGNVMMARQARATEQLAAAAVPAKAPEVARREAPEVHRVSHGEFRIATIEPSVAPTMQLGSRQAAKQPAAEPAEEKAPEIALAETGRVSKQFEVVFGKWLQK